jgi:glutamine amidotransferase
MLAVDPSLFPAIQGSTDSEVVFNLALTFGLDDDPVAAVERAIGFVEATADRHGVRNPVQASMGLSDGERLWAFRYSSEQRSRTLFRSCDAASVRHLHPENERLQRLRDEDRLVVSEPLSDLPGVWNEVPESTVLVIQPGADEHLSFHPRAPALEPAVAGR